ncbi:hypothetical protein [Staphylococcus saccharolyticus]|uniref:Cell wall surface anchor family protein n=1 Tax=Staphylococcus saccharolyticus TaxID=33028 RepID=A0A380H304_9STAP|nr:hypothetical protein [Staphylococcus saccharolyticus]MBL7565977.1 hypothetical protein [Staphylococcus saccharolyticus]MBL7572416.1 hypothetical protein [Staphylococcus saccharolyticus]QQB98552.1 hypothetical protein I6I31_00165 [Staphylococcus saccharolyticus]QRJ67232.1 hypothetical protein DMB76_004180 [Staphylococcus saccharolyticus]RTX92782.1 hypothetical protein CD145_11055 [Staphylococcus saccharolyticus]
MIEYQAVQASSEVSATETKGNSGVSTENKTYMSIKERAPEAPIVEADETNASVDVTPNGESTKLVQNTQLQMVNQHQSLQVKMEERGH